MPQTSLNAEKRSTRLPIIAVTIASMTATWATVASAQSPGNYPNRPGTNNTPPGYAGGSNNSPYSGPAANSGRIAARDTRGNAIGNRPPANPNAASPNAAHPSAANPNGANPNGAPPSIPFPPLSAAEAQQLQSILARWQQVSQSTRTLELQFTRLDFDENSNPLANIPGSISDGLIKYAAPDRGMIRVDQLRTLVGQRADGSPEFKSFPNAFGEYWKCTGEALIQYDREKKKCVIQELPESMRGGAIIESPLPFVFNMDAAKVHQRYWIRQIASPAPNSDMIFIEAHPKRQMDRAEYRMVKIALDAKKFTPRAIVVYAPNFDPKNAPYYQHYDFKDVKRNSITTNLLSKFNVDFIPSKIDKSWTVERDDMFLRMAQ